LTADQVPPLHYCKQKALSSTDWFCDIFACKLYSTFDYDQK